MTEDFSFRSLIKNQTILCQIPILVLVCVAALDTADKQLLASSFPMLERTLGLTVETLGYFSLFTNLSYALSLPAWGYLVHTFGMSRIHRLLSYACASWGVTTVGIALFGHSVVGQAFFRAFNGAALGSILPLSQTLLVEMVDVSMRGRAFGLMGLCEQLAGTLAAASIIYVDPHWEYPYWALGILSIFMGLIAMHTLHPRRRKNVMEHSSKEKEDKTPELTLRQIIQRIVQLPAFLCLVAQGILGGTPWDMMSFLLLLMDWRGFTKEQIVMIQFTSGLTATIGGWLGGLLGDYAAKTSFKTKGRIMLALISVVGGIPLYGFYLFATNYWWALLWRNLFQLFATWVPPGALRPICADLSRNPSERAQIVALWIFLEKASGAIFGAPLVGYLTNNMLNHQNSEGNLSSSGESQEKAQALAWNLFLLSTMFWSICAFFWVLMAFTYPKEGRIHVYTQLKHESKKKLDV